MQLCLSRSEAWAGSCLGHLQALGEAEKGRMRGIPPQCQLGPSLSSSGCCRFMLVFSAPIQKVPPFLLSSLSTRLTSFDDLPSQALMMHTLAMAVLLGIQHVAGTWHL